jgi:hypothetical protein
MEVVKSDSVNDGGEIGTVAAKTQRHEVAPGQGMQYVKDFVLLGVFVS